MTADSKKFRIAVLASGSGTNLQSIIDRRRSGFLDVDIALVISNNPDAGALKKAAQAGIDHICINHRAFSTRQAFDRELVATLQQAEVDLIVLAGFMRIISDVLLTAFPQRIINIHPALLPAFPGLNVQQKALDYGVRFTGCTVHFVDSGVDTGPIIVQAMVPVLATDTAEILSARILEQEHQIYPLAISWFAQDRVRIKGRQVIINGSSNPHGAMINPV